MRRIVLLGALLGIAACGSGSASEAAPAHPFDEAALEALAESLHADGANCVVVEHAGTIVGSWYWDGFAPDQLQEGFSTTKSVAATLVGIAADRGLLSLDDPASRWVTEWQGTPSEPVTVRQLLSNTSGRYHDLFTDYAQFAFLESDKSSFAVGLSQQTAPGSEWVYNNAAVQVLETVLERATGVPVGKFADEALFGPLGASSRLTTDTAGNPGLFAGMQTNCDDLVALALLYLEGGAVNGAQVVSPGFVANATGPSSDLNAGYGLLWWLNRPGTVVGGTGTPEPGPLLDGVPEDVFWASGACGQIAIALPSLDAVASVMRPANPNDPGALLSCGGENTDEALGAGVVAAVRP
jgi:CubicO group peptidase (beta-lactamase class C family)